MADKDDCVFFEDGMCMLEPYNPMPCILEEAGIFDCEWMEELE